MSTTVKHSYTQQRWCENMSVHRVHEHYIHRGTHIQGCCCHEQKNCPITTNTRQKLVNQSFSVHCDPPLGTKQAQSQQPLWWQQQGRENGRAWRQHTNYTTVTSSTTRWGLMTGRPDSLSIMMCASSQSDAGNTTRPDNCVQTWGFTMMQAVSRHNGPYSGTGLP